MKNSLPKNILFCLLICCIWSCKKINASNTVEKSIRRKSENIDYNLVKQNILNSTEINIESSKKLIFNYCVDSIFPAWMGTEWDFNGTTQIPREGKIACGYFVTTIIRDLGFKIDRVKLAQQVSSAIIKQYCTEIKYFSDIEKMVSALSSETNNLFIVGLDFHTGFLVCENRKLYFVHASYGNPRCVVKELANESAVLASSKTFMTGNFLNPSTIKNYWRK
jgi:hypothetical protein